MNKMKVVQCWDDGLVSDIRLIEILSRYNAKASFNLNMGLYKEKRNTVWNYNGHDVITPAHSELVKIFSEFDIANHSLTHPNLTALNRHEIEVEVVDNKKRLEDLFQKPVTGFCYPFGDTNPLVRDIIQKSGHLYARTVKNCSQGINIDDPYQLETTSHFLDPDFWEKYKRSKSDGVFYFWGHSYELVDNDMWKSFEKAIAYINDDNDTEWCSISEIIL